MQDKQILVIYDEWFQLPMSSELLKMAELANIMFS